MPSETPQNLSISGMDTTISCKHCLWMGKVSECIYDAKPLNGDEDGPHAYNCPNPDCKKPLAVQGWLDFYAIEENAVVS